MDKIKFNHSKLRGRIKEKFGTNEKFAEALGVARTTISHKLNNKVDFTSDEILKSCTLLEIPETEVHLYFFNT